KRRREGLHYIRRGGPAPSARRATASHAEAKRRREGPHYIRTDYTRTDTSAAREGCRGGAHHDRASETHSVSLHVFDCTNANLAPAPDQPRTAARTIAKLIAAAALVWAESRCRQCPAVAAPRLGRCMMSTSGTSRMKMISIS